VYGLPLVGAYDDKLNFIDEAGLIAGANRPAGPESFYKQGLDGIKFADPVGVVDATDAETGNLNLLNKKVQTYVTAATTKLAHDMVTVDEAKNLINAIKDKHPEIGAGLASLALQSSWVTDLGAAAKQPNTTGAASANAFKLVTGDYDYTKGGGTDPEKIKQSQLLERIESVGIDLAVLADADKRAKTQAPAYDVARYSLKDPITQVAGLDVAGGKTVDDIWEKVKVANSASFGVGANLKVEDGSTPDNALGIAGAVAAVEGSLGWAVANIYTDANKFHSQKLLPAVQTMHADANYAAFDYVRVGADPKRLSYNTSALVQDVQVLGDTVYVALGSSRDADHLGESGVFSSTAIFHQDGHVRSWTPWRRVMGHADPVAGVALDPTSSRYWYTTTKGAELIEAPSAATPGAPLTDSLNTLRVTAWGRGHNSSTAGDARLSTILDQVFGDIGGVFGLYSFGPDTQGFKERDPSAVVPADRHEQFSMTVATGNGRVALIKTGKFDGEAGVFKPTTAFNATSTTGDKNVFVFDVLNKHYAGTALANLGIITCAEVSRLPLDDANNRLGFLFVGGTNGVAVLTRWFNGKGWDTSRGGGLADLQPGAQRDDFPAGDGWRWMQILQPNGKNPFKNVRKITSDGSRYLYVMTATQIWRIDMTAGAKKSGDYGIFKRRPTPSAGTPKPVDLEYAIELEAENHLHVVADHTAAAGAVKLVEKEGGQFLDMLVGYRKNDATPADARTQLVVGTTSGLFYTQNDKLTDEFKAAKLPLDNWTQLKTYAKAAGGGVVDEEVKGAVMRLEFTSSQPGDKLKKALDVKKVAQSYADGNLQVTAFDKDSKFLSVYRFNLTGGDAAGAVDWENPEKLFIAPFKEPYHDGGDAQATTPYFYKVGTLGAGEKVEFNGPFDYFTRTAHVTGSAQGFSENVWMMPQPALFTRDVSTGNFEDIDLALDLTLPLYLGNVQIDPATGAEMVAGEFGLRVND
jgi:hypothetical protein